MAGKVDFFEARARTWEETCYPPKVRGRLEALLPEFGVSPGETVLDVGTGPGILIPYVRRLVGPSGRVLAFDLAWAMTLEARKKCHPPQAAVVQADVHWLPCRSGAFDRVLCFAAFPHFDDPSRAVAEMARALKPGGRLIIAHLLSRDELARHHASHQRRPPGRSARRPRHGPPHGRGGLPSRKPRGRPGPLSPEGSQEPVMGRCRGVAPIARPERRILPDLSDDASGSRTFPQGLLGHALKDRSSEPLGSNRHESAVPNRRGATREWLEIERITGLGSGVSRLREGINPK